MCACGSDCNDCGLSACAEPLGWGPDKVHGVDGWTRMEGGGQGPGGRFAYGAWGNPPGYTYHHGAAQTCVAPSGPGSGALHPRISAPSANAKKRPLQSR